MLPREVRVWLQVKGRRRAKVCNYIIIVILIIRNFMFHEEKCFTFALNYELTIRLDSLGVLWEGEGDVGREGL